MPILHVRDKNGVFIPINAIKGEDGKSAYQQAVDGGYKGTEEEFISILNGIAGDAAHFFDYGNPHKVTAEQVTSLKIYKSFDAMNKELGTSFNSDTPIATIIAAMPDNTGLKADINTVDTGSSGTTIYPAVYGVLSIYKIRSNRVEVEYASNVATGGKEYNKRWIGQYNSGVFGGFVEVYTKENKPTASEVGALPVSGGEMKGYIRWNGGKTHIFGQGDGNFIIQNYKLSDDGNDDFLSMHNKVDIKQALKFYRNGKAYKIYGDHNASDVGIPKIERGSYVGTGSASSSPAISCNCYPLFVAVYGTGHSSGGTGVAIRRFSDPDARTAMRDYTSSNTTFDAECKWGSNYVQLMNGTSAGMIANNQGSTYDYFIIGV